MNSEIQSRKERWKKFYDGSDEVSRIVMISYFNGIGPAPIPFDGDYELRHDWILKRYERMIDNLEWLNDDAVPYLSMATGTEIFAEAFGCEVKYPNDTNPFAMPLINDLREISSIKVPDWSNTRLADLMEMAKRIRDEAGEDALLKITDVQSPADIAALVLNKEEFFVGLLTQPQAVVELMEKTYILLTGFMDAWFKEFGHAFIAHYPDYYMDYGISLSEDEVGSINPEIFENYFLPFLNRLSEHYGQIGIHCCADSIHQWENFAKIKNLKVLNIVQPPDVCQKSHRFFENVCCQMPHHYLESPPDTWKTQMPKNARIIYKIRECKDKDEALYMLDALR